jgi:3-oxoacyl-[acyl-carrier protein] reductase
MATNSAQITVIITGGAGGLGRAMTLGLAKAGVNVVAAELGSRQAAVDELMQIAGNLGLKDKVATVACDVTKADDCVAAVQAARERFGGVHGLVNNAAIGMQDFGPVQVGTRRKFYEADAAAWCRSIETNACGPYLMTRAITPHLVQQGWGRIVNVTTSHNTMVAEGFSPYGPSKAALEAASVIFAKDLAGTGVTVNILIPGGPANTRMIPQGEVSDRSALIQPEMMVAPITWLMSHASDGVSSRRIIAKQWDAKAAADNPSGIGAPAGWPT